MAPLPPESTPRLYLDYSDGVNQHSLIARLGTGTSSTTGMDYVDQFMLELSPSLYLITVIGCRIASDESNVTNPIAWTGDFAYGSGTMPPVNAPREIRFQGRSTDGRQVSVSVYGYKEATPAVYRINSGVDTNVDDAIDKLAVASAAGVFVTISSNVPIWKQYASFNFNSYWERRARP